MRIILRKESRFSLSTTPYLNQVIPSCNHFITLSISPEFLKIHGSFLIWKHLFTNTSKDEQSITIVLKWYFNGACQRNPELKIFYFLKMLKIRPCVGYLLQYMTSRINAARIKRRKKQAASCLAANPTDRLSAKEKPIVQRSKM